MVRRLIQAYCGKGTISRGELLLGISMLYVAVALCLYLHSRLWSSDRGVRYLIEHSVLELLLVAGSIPLVTATVLH